MAVVVVVVWVVVVLIIQGVHNRHLHYTGVCGSTSTDWELPNIVTGVETIWIAGV